MAENISMWTTTTTFGDVPFIYLIKREDKNEN